MELSRFFLDERGYAHGTERKPFDPKTAVLPPKPEGPQTAEQRRAYFQARLRVRNGRMQDHKPVVDQYEAVGHAVRAGYMYAAMADIVRFMDAPGYERALDHLWDAIRDKSENLAMFKRIKYKECITLVDEPFQKSAKLDIKRHLHQ